MKPELSEQTKKLPNRLNLRANPILQHRPGGPRCDTPANATWNRNKRSIVLDLKTGAGRDSTRQLIAGADVVVENFRPGVMDRLGLGPAAMTGAHPRLIYCSISGFGQDGPYRDRAALDLVVQAESGMDHITPWVRAITSCMLLER